MAIPDARRLVCVGRLCAQKGQVLLIKAAAEVVKRGAELELVLVGDGEMREAVEAEIARHGLESCVTVTGWASGEEVVRQIEAGRALVLPSFAEGLPVVIMEALALGRPVISTYVGGIAELIEPGINGWLVAAGSVPALVDAMVEALDAVPERLQEMGEAGAHRVAERHSATKEACRLGNLFGEAIRRSGRDMPCPTGVLVQTSPRSVS